MPHHNMPLPTCHSCVPCHTLPSTTPTTYHLPASCPYPAIIFCGHDTAHTTPRTAFTIRAAQYLPAHARLPTAPHTTHLPAYAPLPAPSAPHVYSTYLPTATPPSYLPARTHTTCYAAAFCLPCCHPTTYTQHFTSRLLLPTARIRIAARGRACAARAARRRLHARMHAHRVVRTAARCRARTRRCLHCRTRS